jgi:hypothetical protein
MRSGDGLRDDTGYGDAVRGSNQVVPSSVKAVTLYTGDAETIRGLKHGSWREAGEFVRAKVTAVRSVG